MICQARVAIGAKVDRGETADANRDAMRDSVAGATFERVAEAVPEVQQQPLILVELVDFDEPLLRAEAELNHSLIIVVGQRNIVIETLLAAREADLRRFAPAGRDMLG